MILVVPCCALLCTAFQIGFGNDMCELAAYIAKYPLYKAYNSFLLKIPGLNDWAKTPI